MVQAVHQAYRTQMRRSRRAMHLTAHQEERYELRTLFLDVFTSFGAIRGEREEYTVEVPNVHMV